LKFVKYLRDFGWEPVIFCPENPEYPEYDPSLARDIPDHIETLTCRIWEPYDAYKKFLGQKKETKISAGFLSETKKNKFLECISVWIRGNLFIPDARKFWIAPSVRKIRDYLSGNQVDVVISTGPPHSTHLIARKISREFSLPWLADFRDPWTNIDFYKDLKLTGWADRKHRRLERSVLKDADAVTVISNTMSDDFNRLCPRSYDVITNGFDPADVQSETNVIPDEKFSIAHIGTLGPARNPEILWKALQELVGAHPDLASYLEIKLVGKVDVSVINSIEAYSLGKFVRRIAYMPHDEVVVCQRQSRVLLLIINNTPNAAMILTGKFFEYMAAGRPILCIGPEKGDAATILAETNSGLLAGFDDVRLMKSHILTLFDEYRKGVSFVTSPDVERYSRKELTGQLAKILDRLKH
jgi:glycosyltransferase involved in cell wall biosynthesis